MPGLSERLTSCGRRLMAAGNHDFCPGLNRYFHWLKQPIGWFVIAATASLLVALVLGPQGWVLFAGITSVALLGVLWPALAIRGLGAELSFERRRVTEQQTVRVKLTVVNRWPLPIWGLSLDRGFAVNSDRSGRPVIALGCVRPWSTAEFEWDYVPESRGVLPIAEPILSNGFPFGIWQAECPVRVPVKLLVWPRTFTLDGIPEISGNRFAVTGMLQSKAGHDGEFIGIRPYRQGDSLRHVHWAQTARQDELIVCERQTHCRRSVRIELEPAAPLNHTGEAWELEREWLFRVAASLCRAFHSHRFQIACAIGDELIELSESASDIKPVLDRMATWMPSLTAPVTPLPSATGNPASSSVTGARGSDARDQRVSPGSTSLRLLVLTPEQLAARTTSAQSDERLVLIQTGAAKVGSSSAEPALSAAASSRSPAGTGGRVLLRVSIDQLAQHIAPQWMALGESTHAA